MTGSDFAAWMAAIQERTEAALARFLPEPGIAPQRLHEAMRYAVLGGGKRVRPLLCHGAGVLTGAAPQRLDVAACAVEMIHAYSLVHDDLPCMDDDTLRRGKPTCHVEFDEATALLVGDSLQSQAFLLLGEHRICDDPARQLEAVRILAQASGSRGMAGGQAMDIAGTGKNLSLQELELMHIHKTGALIRAAVLLGTYCGTPLGRDETEQLDHFAKCAGLLFQVVDDILDESASTATLGKTAGKDAAQNKATYVSLLGIARARELAEELRERAEAALAPFGDSGRRLRELTRFIVTRKF